MARELMPKSGIMMPHVVINRDAAVVGVSTVDGAAGAITLTGKYLQKTDAENTYMTKADGATKVYVADSIAPIMEGALFKADPFVANDVPFRSAGANGVESVDMIKVTPENTIKIGSYASSVQGVEVHTAGRLQVVDLNDGGVETKYPIYSKRYRPEIDELPFAAIGSYVKDSKGRTIGVNRTGINSDITQMTQKVTFTQPVTVADAVGDYDAVTYRQLKNQGGGSGGPTMSGISNFGIGDFHLRDSRAFIPAFEVVADGQLLNRTDYPDLWAYAQLLTPITDAAWLADPKQRGRYSLGDGTTTFRVPDRNGVQPGSIQELFARGDGGVSNNNGKIFRSAAPNIVGGFVTLVNDYNYGVIGSATGAMQAGAQDKKRPNVSADSGANTAAASVGFDASLSSPVYGRDSTTEVYPSNVVGVWTIRANGGFTAANTSWSVINGDNTTPSPGVNVQGGRVNSVYQVAGADQASANFYSQKAIGDTKAKAIIQANNPTLGVSKLLVFDTAGDLYTEGTVNAKRHFVSNPTSVSFDGYWGSTNIPFHVDVPAVAGEGYLYPLMSQKVYWASHYAAAWSLGTWCQADGPHFSLTWNAEAGQNKSWFFVPTSGNATAPGSWVNGSDERHKSNITVVENALEAVCSWRGAVYDKKDGGREVGLIAQDVEKDCPEAVSEQERTFQDGEVIKDFKYLNTAGVSAAYHTEAIKELASLVEALSMRVSELEKTLSEK